MIDASLRPGPQPMRIAATTFVTMLAALVVLLVGGWQIMRSRDVAIANAGHQAAGLATALAQHAARTIEGADVVLSEVIERLRESPDPAGIGTFLKKRSALLGQIHTLAVLAPDGGWAFDSGDDHEAISSADRSYFAWHRDHADQGLHVDLPFASRYDDKTVIPISRRLEQRGGGFAGVVRATLLPESFRTFYATLDIGKNGAAALWLDTGRLLVRAPEAPLMMGRDVSGGRLFSLEAAKRPAGVYRTDASIVDGMERIVAFRHVDRYPLLVTASVAVETAIEPWRREALVQTFVIAVSTVALIGLAIGLERRQRHIAASERTSREAEVLFRGLFENATDFQAVYRVESDEVFRLETWNPSAAAIMGLTAEDAKGRRIEEVVPAEHIERLRRGLQLAVMTGEPIRAEDHELLGGVRKSWEMTHVPLRDPVSETVTRVFVGVRDITHLKAAEAEAREANRLLVMAEQIAHVGHWHIDLPSRTLTWSDEIFRIHGLSPESFTPTLETAVSAYHPDDRERVAACVAQAVERQADFEFTLRIVRPDGDVRDVLARGICEVARSADDKADEVRSIFGAFADLTDLKNVQRALAEKSDLLEATLESMDQGLLLIDAEGTVPIVNRRAVELLDLPPQMMVARPAYREVRDLLRRTGSWGESIQDPTYWELDGERRTSDLRSERRRADGSILEIRSLPMRNGDGYIQTLTDVTSRRQAEERLRESEARYRLLADHTSDLIVLERTDGRHLYISPAVTSLLGYLPEEAVAIGLRSLIDPDDLPKLAGALEALHAAEPTGSVVYRLRHRSGAVLWVEAALRRVEDQGEVRIIQAIRDVTQRQRQAEHLERAKSAAEAGARIKAEFLANMSHELRTPLTGMLGVHDLLQTDSSLTPSQGRLIGLAQESGRSLLTIVNDILDFSKIEAGQLAIEALPFGLRALLESCRNLALEAARSRDVAVVSEIDAAIPDWFIGDPTRLRQVILNLLTNAIKFTPRGTITLRAQWSAEPERPSMLRIAVNDTGIGIAADKLPRLFERFSQADGSVSRTYGGTGLGLVISKRLVELMGGAIGVTSRVDEGSTFWFEMPLPVAQARGSDAVAPRPVTTSEGPTGRRLLLAEDNLINQEIIGTVLRKRGHTVNVVADGGAAVAAVKADPSYDLVLMDVQMPGQDGLSATAAIREEERTNGRRRLPIVALTANAMAEEVARCRAAGMDAHVAKPVHWPELFATMERLWDEKPAAARTLPAVLDGATLARLAEVFGDARLTGMLSAFVSDIRQRLTKLHGVDLSADTLSREASALEAPATQLGFFELAIACSEIVGSDQDEVAMRASRLATAIARAIEAAARSSYARAA